MKQTRTTGNFLTAAAVHLAALAATLLIAQPAHGFAFLLDPQADPANNPFGRMLWNVAPDGRRVVTLNYAFAPQLNAQFEWTSSNGERIRTDSRGFIDTQKDAVRTAAGTWNNRTPTKDNVVGQDTRNMPDLESIALHEFGHALGLGHPHKENAHTNSRQQLVVEVSPANVNVNGTPATFPVPRADKNNLRQSNVVQAETALARPIAAGTKSTQAVMVQGAFAGEVRRTLAYDDIQGLSALESGRDFVNNNGAGDDFVFFLNEVPYASGRQLINIVNATLPDDVGGRTTLSTKKANYFGTLFGADPTLIDKSLLRLDFTFDPASGLPDDVYGWTDIWLTYPDDVYGTRIGAVQIFVDADRMFVDVSEPPSLMLLASAPLMAAITLALRRRRASGLRSRPAALFNQR